MYQSSTSFFGMYTNGKAVGAREIIEQNITNGKIQKAMDGYEFMKIQGELIRRNQEEASRNQKSTKEMLLEQDPAAPGRWYTYGSDSRRYTFDEFCKLRDDMWAKERANAGIPKNDYLEIANQYLQEKEIEEDPLGMGFALAGNMGYGMSASLVTSDANSDVIVRVKVAQGGGVNETVDVNLSEFDPKNATAVEMFAYCQYQDAIGGGSDYKWGSWNAVKTAVSPADGLNFGSLDNIMNEKRNWTGALAGAKTTMENQKTGETLTAADLLRMFEEQNKLTAEELKQEDDWRSMSEDDWDKLLSGVDEYIDAYKADIRERVKKQLEAAQKAALAADPEMKSTAAKEAALSVAASGFDSGSPSEGKASEEPISEAPGTEHEKNWTRSLKTDDQVVLRTAKEAQTMESMTMNRIAEITISEVAAYESHNGVSTWYRRDRRFMNFA